MLPRSALSLVAAVTFADMAHATYLSYPQWIQLSDTAQAFYVEGAFDSFTSLAEKTDPLVPALVDCVSRKQITAAQIAKGMAESADRQPQYRTTTVPQLMLLHLYDICGLAAGLLSK